jgi:hypothetical protein
VSNAGPHPGLSLVPGGVVAASESFIGVFTLGQAPGGNGLSSSENYQLRGGLVGSTQ